MSSFQFSALPAAPFTALFELNDRELGERNMIRQTVTAHPGYPCRVSLEDAAVGEEVILLSFEHQSAASPYRSGGAIYVRKHAIEAQLGVGEVPAFLLHRLLSVRAYDSTGMMRSAETVAGTDLKAAIPNLFNQLRIDYLHVHNAGPGCYSCRVDRAK